MENSGLFTTGLSLGAHNYVQAASDYFKNASGSEKDPFTGIQMGSHNPFDEGIESCFDLIQDTAHVNAVFLPLVWFKTHEKYYKNTFMRHWKPTRENEFYGRDLFRKVQKPAEERGIKVYARMLEGYQPFLADALPGYKDVISRLQHLWK